MCAELFIFVVLFLGPHDILCYCCLCIGIVVAPLVLLSSLIMHIHTQHTPPPQTQDVTLLHYKQWPEMKWPKSASFLKLFTSAQKLQQPHSDKPIVVACK